MDRLFTIAMVTIFGAYTSAQNLENLDFISGFNEGIAAVKQDGKWGFIDDNGKMVVPFRRDLVVDEDDPKSYPLFSDGRGLIKTVKNGIDYFGYIDDQGKTIIEPQYLNASAFNDGHAIVLLLEKEDLGKNDVLGKEMVRYSYSEVVIDKNANVIKYLTDARNVALDEQYLLSPIKIGSRFISDNLIKVPSNSKWTIVNLNDD